MADKSILGGVRPLHFPFIGTLNNQDSDTIGSSDARLNQFSFFALSSFLKQVKGVGNRSSLS